MDLHVDIEHGMCFGDDGIVAWFRPTETDFDEYNPMVFKCEKCGEEILVHTTTTSSEGRR